MRWENSNSFFTPPMNFFIRCSQNKESAMRIEKYFKSLKVGDQLSWCEKVNEEISYENSNLNESLSFSLGDSEKIVAVDLHELEDSIDLFFI